MQVQSMTDHNIERRESLAAQISYCSMALDGGEPNCFGTFTSHHRRVTQASPRERLKIGGGTPPLRTRHGWLAACRSVSETVQASQGTRLPYNRIAVARLDLPDSLPPAKAAGRQEAKG
jgi:hypothetical protein